MSRFFYRIVDEEGLPLKTVVKELLPYAKARGYKLAVATSSGREYSTKMLREAGIYTYFDGCVFGDMVQNSKPHPEIYRKACECIDTPPKCCLAFEDAPAGIRSAHDAGLKVIAVPDLLEPPEEVLPMIYRRYETLLDVIPFLDS